MIKQINHYMDINIIIENWNGRICIFGKGRIGKGYGYGLLKAAGCKIAFFCDNNIEDDEIVIDGIKGKTFEFLLSRKDEMFVVVCMAEKNWEEIEEQFASAGINHYVFFDTRAMALVMESIDHANESIKKQYHTYYENETYLEDQFKKYVGYELNLKNPTSFNEKLQWLKLFDRKPVYTTMVDKYDVKKYVSSIIGEEYIIPTIGIWNHFDEIDFELLPNQFALKCTHDSGSVVICNDKNSLDMEMARNKIEKRLDLNYYWFSREWPYKNVKPRIIAEELLTIDSDDIRDYKFFTFNGSAKVMFIASDRQTIGVETKFDFFDMEYNRLPFTNGHPNSECIPQRPQNFEKMKDLAEKLSQGIPQVRVDFYEVDSKIYFGEFTFFHWGGLCPFDPVSWDYKLGSWIKLT